MWQEILKNVVVYAVCYGVFFFIGMVYGTIRERRKLRAEERNSGKCLM